MRNLPAGVALCVLFVIAASADPVTITFTVTEGIDVQSLNPLFDPLIGAFSGTLVLCESLDPASAGGFNPAVPGCTNRLPPPAQSGPYLTSDILQWGGGAFRGFFSDSEPGEVREPGDIADGGIPSFTCGPELNEGCFYALEPDVQDGAEKYIYNPVGTQPGASSDPSKFIYKYIVYSDTPEPASLLLLGSVAVALTGAYRRMFYRSRP